MDRYDRFVRVGTKLEARRLGLWNRGVHIFVINNRKDLLICKRPISKRAYPGLITSSAGGHVEVGEDYLTAARREVYEELGLRCRLRDLGRFDVVSRSHGKTIHRLFLGDAENVRAASASEIVSLEFRHLDEVLQDVEAHPNRYAYPFRQALALFIGVRESREGRID